MEKTQPQAVPGSSSWERQIAAVAAGVATAPIAAWMVFAWATTLGNEAFHSLWLIVILGAAVGLLAWWYVHRLITATWGAKSGRCFSIAAISLFVYLVIAVSGHVIDRFVGDGLAGVGATGVLVLLSRRYGSPMAPDQTGNVTPKHRPIPHWVIVAVAAIGAAVAGEFLSGAIDPPEGTTGRRLPDNENMAGLRIFEIVVATPIFEELCFRGVLLAGLRFYFGSWTSAGISSLLFALFHPGDAAYICAVVARSLVWAVAVLKSRSVIPAVAAHAAHNALGAFGFD